MKGPQNYQVLIKFTSSRGTNLRQASCTLHPSLRKIVMGIMRIREWGCQSRSFILPKQLFIYHRTKLFINWKHVPRQASCTLHPSLRKIVMGIMWIREWGCQRRSFILPKQLFIYHWTKLFINWKHVLALMLAIQNLRHYMQAYTLSVISKDD